MDGATETLAGDLRAAPQPLRELLQGLRMTIVFLYGPPASGKLTIAKALAELTGLALFHNHLVVDAVASVFPFGSKPFVKLREQFWLAMFREAAEAKRSLIFTFAPEASVAPDFPDRARQTIVAAGGDMTLVRLTVSPDEQRRRIGNVDRAAFGKLRSPSLLQELQVQFAACEAAMPPAALTIDTDTIDPVAASQLIAETFGWRRT